MKKTILALLASLLLLAGCEGWELEDHGGEGQPCFGNNSCDGGLVCVKGICVPPTGEDGDVEPDADEQTVDGDVDPDETVDGDMDPDAEETVDGDVEPDADEQSVDGDVEPDADEPVDGDIDPDMDEAVDGDEDIDAEIEEQEIESDTEGEEVYGYSCCIDSFPPSDQSIMMSTSYRIVGGLVSSPAISPVESQSYIIQGGILIETGASSE